MKFECEDIFFVPITTLLSEVIDNRGRTCPTAEKGIPLIATNCIGNENLYPVKKNIRQVSLETYNTWFRGHPEPGDVIFVNKGTPGRVCLVPDPIDFCIAQDMVSLRVNEKINNLYLLAAIRAPQVQNQIQKMQVGTILPNFKKGDFEKLLIPMRDMPTQKAIGKIYFELSLKIDLNERTSKTLESITQTLFKSWFLDLDPVKANMAGEKPAGMDAVTAALFPDSIEESELGLIPKGWSIESIGNIAIIQGGKMLSREEFSDDGRFPIFGGAGVMGKSNKSNAEGFVITVGRVGAYCGQFFYHRGSAWVNNNASRIIPKENISGEWMYQFLKSFNIESIKKGAAQPFVSNSDLANSKIVLPSLEIIRRFTEIVRPIFEQREALADENLFLGKLRDSLLPRLISGELKIPEEMLAS